MQSMGFFVVRSLRVFVVGLTLLLVLSSCSFVNFAPDSQASIRVALPIAKKTALSSKDPNATSKSLADVVKYRVTGAGPEGATLDREAEPGETILIDGLAPGSWTLTVEAYGANNLLLAIGTIEAVLELGENSLTLAMLSALAELRFFDIPSLDVKGQIENQNRTVLFRLPGGAAVTSLLPDFSHSGAGLARNGADLVLGASTIDLSSAGTLDLRAKNGASYSYVLSTQTRSWTQLGSDLTSFDPSSHRITFALDGTPWIAYSVGSFDQFNIAYFDGSSWITVGGTLTSVLNLDLAIDHDGRPWIAYRRGSAPNDLAVKRFDGTSWQFVGPDGIVGGTNIILPKIRFDSQGRAYVVYRESQTAPYNYSASAITWDGSTWNFVGARAFTNAAVDQVVITFDSSDTPYVAVDSTDAGTLLAVYRYQNGAWANLGLDIAGGGIISIGIVIDPRDTLYVSYSYDLDSDPYVRRYESGTWNILGGSAVQAVNSNHVRLSISPLGRLYVATVDSAGGAGNADLFAWNGSSWVLQTIGMLSGVTRYNLNHIVDDNGDWLMSYSTTSTATGPISIYSY